MQMKKIFTIPIYLFFTSCAFTPAGHPDTMAYSDGETKKEFVVAGQIQYAESYCGGARPTDEMLMEITRARPYPGKKLFVIEGTKNSSGKEIAATVISDSSGNFKLILPPGEYCIIQPDQRSTAILSKYNSDKDDIDADPKCMEEWWNSCLYSFRVDSADINGISLFFQRRCFLPEGIPCLRYSGPMRP